jgi:hypothetical protein
MLGQLVKTHGRDEVARAALEQPKRPRGRPKKICTIPGVLAKWVDERAAKLKSDGDSQFRMHAIDEAWENEYADGRKISRTSFERAYCLDKQRMLAANGSGQK